MVKLKEIILIKMMKENRKRLANNIEVTIINNLKWVSRYFIQNIFIMLEHVTKVHSSQVEI